jgi:hypothetical protein
VAMLGEMPARSDRRHRRPLARLPDSAAPKVFSKGLRDAPLPGAGRARRGAAGVPARYATGAAAACAEPRTGRSENAGAS